MSAEPQSLLRHAREAEIRDLVTRWMAEPEPKRPGHATCVSTLPASPDDVLWLLDQVEALRTERDLVYGELNRALGQYAPQAWERIKAALLYGGTGDYPRGGVSPSGKEQP